MKTLKAECRWQKPTDRLRRRGYTIVEILVVTGIIAVLLAIIVPAVMASRGAARRLECQNRMRQWGVALHGFEAAHKYLPFGVECNSEGFTTSKWQWTSVQVHCLPYLEQSAAYEQLMSAEHRRFNDPEMKFQFPVFHCPLEETTTGLSYRTCTGRGFRYHEPSQGTAIQVRDLGLFPGGKNCKGTAFADVSGGLSNTAAMSERSMGRGFTGAYDRSRDIWYSGVVFMGFDLQNATADDAVNVCSAMTGDPSPLYSPFAGHDYATDGFLHTSYNHALPPNSSVADCSLEPMGGDDPAKAYRGNARVAVVAARSQHSGGSVSLLCLDGSVRLVSSGVDLELWRGLASRSGSDASLPLE